MPYAYVDIGLLGLSSRPRNHTYKCVSAFSENGFQIYHQLYVVGIGVGSELHLHDLSGFTEWITSWRKSAWMNSKGEPVKNREVICYIDALLEKRKSVGQKVPI